MVKEIEANLAAIFREGNIFLKVAKSTLLRYPVGWSVSYIAMITKSNPKQAIDLTIAHTKFGKDMSNIFP